MSDKRPTPDIKPFTVNSASVDDVSGIFELYLKVAAIEGGLARVASEVSTEYVSNFVGKSVENGVILIARDTVTNKIIGEIHGYSLGIKVFAHIIGEVTILVHPDYQGFGVGRALFTDFMRCIEKERPDILRVELIARESNTKAIRFYEKMGFRVEGRFENRIASVNGGFEADIPMAWTR
jgi:putative acetyltransferase